jgi:hypothetical protein
MTTKPIEHLDRYGKELAREVCQVCGYEFDCASAPYDGNRVRPKPGDLTICLKCGELYMYDENMRVVMPTIDCLNAIDKKLRFQIEAAQLLIRKTRPVK